MRTVSHLPQAGLVGLGAGFYALAAYGALHLAVPGTNASPVWPPAGLAFMALWFFGYGLWPAVWIGAFAANLATFLHSGVTLTPALLISGVISCGNALEAVLGVFLLRCFTEKLVFLANVRDIFKFIFVTLVAASSSATIGTSVVYFSHIAVKAPYDTVWFTWWMGDVVGTLTVASIFLTFHKKLWRFDSWQQAIEALLIGIALVIVSAGIFMGRFPPSQFYSLTYVILPLVIWATYRFGYPGATLSVFIASLVATWGSLHQQGPFASTQPQHALLLMQCFMGIIEATVLTLAAALYERQAAEEQIKRNEARYRNLVENSFEVVALVGKEGQVSYTSPPTKNILGYETKELVGRSMFDLMHPQDIPHIRAKFQEVLQSPGAIMEAVCRLQHKDGSWRWLEGSGHNLLQDAAISAIVVNYRDITERKKIEEDRLYMAAIVANTDEAILSKSLDGTITSWNRGAEKLYGYTLEEIIGKSIKLLVPQDKQEELEKIFESLNAGRQIQSLETQRLRKNGTRIDVSLTISPIKNANGAMIGASAIARDITERKRAQLALEESEDRFRTMADTAPVMIWMSGADGLYTFFNKAWLIFTGQTLPNEIGNGWRNQIYPQDTGRCMDMYWKAFENHEKFVLDYRVRRADGIYRWVLDTGVPRFTSLGHFAGYIGSRLDITELKLAQEVLKRDKESLEQLVDERSKELIKAQEELKQASRLADIGTLAATVAHELRNPLGVIQIAAYNLKMEKDILKNDRHLVNIEKKVWEGNQIIDNLLSYARIKIPFYETMQVEHALDECVASSLSRFESKGIRIDKKYQENLGTIEADTNQIREIFVNILNNACQSFTDPGGKVSLEAWREKDLLKVQVQDTGGGIAPEDLSKVFEPFFTRKSKGTGLGLTICSEMVHLHQGTIEIKSKIGEGTVVVVSLPVKRKKHEETINH